MQFRSIKKSRFVLRNNKVNRSHCIKKISVVMKEELRVPWNSSESHLHSVSSSNPYVQVEKGVRAAFRGSWRWKPASLSLHQVSSGTRHQQNVSVTYAFLFWGFFQKDFSNFIAKNWVNCFSTNQTYCLHFDLCLK